jgi:hypothetical protein
MTLNYRLSHDRKFSDFSLPKIKTAGFENRDRPFDFQNSKKQSRSKKEANSRNLAKLFERFGRRASGPICYFKYLELLVFSKAVLEKLGKNGGEGEIRTHGGISPSPVFKTGALNHSATSPYGNPSKNTLREWSAATRCQPNEIHGTNQPESSGVRRNHHIKTQ